MALRITGVVRAKLGSNLAVLEASVLRRTVAVLSPRRSELALAAVLRLLGWVAALLTVALLIVALRVLTLRVTLASGLRRGVRIVRHDRVWDVGQRFDRTKNQWKGFLCENEVYRDGLRMLEVSMRGGGKSYTSTPRWRGARLGLGRSSRSCESKSTATMSLNPLSTLPMAQFAAQLNWEAVTSGPALSQVPPAAFPGHMFVFSGSCGNGRLRSLHIYPTVPRRPIVLLRILRTV